MKKNFQVHCVLQVAKMSLCGCVCVSFLSGKRTKCHKSVTMCRKVSKREEGVHSKRVKAFGGRRRLAFLLLCA